MMNDFYDPETKAVIQRNSIIVLSIIGLICLVILALVITRLFGFWPDWMIELELIGSAML